MSPRDKQSRIHKQKRRTRSSKNKYLKPGALAQLRYSKASAAKSCTDLGKKRIAVMDADEPSVDGELESEIIAKSPLILSPVGFRFGSVCSPFDMSKVNNLQKTPKTPGAEVCESESRLESLPMDLLVIQARQFHFNYTTPDRTRQEMLRIMTPLPTDHWPFVSKGDGKDLVPSPHTPKAPRHGPRPPSRLKHTEMRQIAAVLFQESAFPSSRCLVPSVLSKPLCKSLGSNRVLFYEDELCQAVAQNKLL
nr:F-box protein At4g35930 [Ipomoea batatas]GMC76979.1 F-box protein At4g35930 [Ipomoea batatas]